MFLRKYNAIFNVNGKIMYVVTKILLHRSLIAVKDDLSMQELKQYLYVFDILINLVSYIICITSRYVDKVA